MLRLLIAVSLLSIAGSAFAHPGNTAADGCHYCRTNCDKWGEVWDERHCHGGYAAPTRVYTPPKPRCPTNSTLVGDTCFCKEGYAAFQNSCIKIPANAHEVTSPTDAWACDYGFIEKGNSCVLKPVPVTSSSSSAKITSKSSSSVIKASSSDSIINQSVDLSPPAATPVPSGGFWNRIWSFFK